MLEPVRVLAVTAVLGPPRRLHIGRAPGLRPERAERGRRVKRPCPHLHVVRLEDHATLVGPEALELQDQVLERRGLSRTGRLGHVFALLVHSTCTNSYLCPA